MRCLFITESARREQSRHLMFNYIHEELAKQNIEFEILAFLESENQPILSDCGLNVPTKSIAKDLFIPSTLWKFVRSVYSSKPNIMIIGGYGYKELWVALLIGLFLRIPIILWTGAGQITTANHSKIILNLKKLFIKNIDRAITYGSNATKYLCSLGMDIAKIDQGINVSSISLFKETLNNYGQSNELIQNLKNINIPILIYVGRLEQSKGIDLLIEQLKLIPQDRYICYFVGKGSMESKIKESIKNKEINARLLGFLKQNEIAKRLVEADVYILPSRNDPFSRTLSEALASGCFVLNSKYDDASYDLISSGKNGYIFDPTNFNEFKYYMNLVTDTSWKRPSRKKISDDFKFDITDYANSVINAVLKVKIK